MPSFDDTLQYRVVTPRVWWLFLGAATVASLALATLTVLGIVTPFPGVTSRWLSGGILVLLPALAVAVFLRAVEVHDDVVKETRTLRPRTFESCSLRFVRTSGFVHVFEDADGRELTVPDLYLNAERLVEQFTRIE